MASKIASFFRFATLMKLFTITSLAALLLSYIAPFVHPENLWILPFFGLCYPITLLFAILFLIYWTFLQSKWALLLLATILLGYNFHFELLAYSANDEIQKDSTETLKILSNNVRIFDLYNSESEQKFATRDSIFNYAIASNADVVCFQEFYRKDAPTNFSTTELFVKQFGAVDYHERLIYKKIGHQHFGITLFSKYPIIAKGDVIFETEDNDNVNFSIFADIVKNKDTFRIYNVHLQSIKMGDEVVKDQSSMIERWIDKLRVAYPIRANQAFRISEHIKSSPFPVIVCGDFNDTPISFVYNQFENQLTDAFLNCGSGIGSTYVGKVPAGRIDYIFHSPELESSNFVIQANPFSDHRAIECIISKK